MKKLRLRRLTCPRPLDKEFVMGLLTIVWINYYTVLLELFPVTRSHHLKKIERTGRAGMGEGENDGRPAKQSRFISLEVGGNKIAKQPKEEKMKGRGKGGRGSRALLKGLRVGWVEQWLGGSQFTFLIMASQRG